MIHGIGTDICSVKRIQELLEKNGDQFINRIFTQDEINSGNTENANFVARRFAAKEACAKAIGTGIGSQLSFQDISIERVGNKPPAIKMHNENFKHLRFNLSISDEKEYAVAFVIAQNEV